MSEQDKSQNKGFQPHKAKGEKRRFKPSLQKGMDEALRLMDRGMARVRARTSKEEAAAMREKLSRAEDDFADEVREELDDENAAPEKVRGAKLLARKEAQKKRRKKMIIYAGVAVFLVWAIWFLFAPYKAGMTYGICHTFLQQQVAYPEHLRLSEVEDLGESVRIWYVRTDPFGEDRMESMRCYFRYMNDGEEVKYGNAPFIIDRVTRDRRPYDQTKVDAFNRSIVAVIAAKPDLVIPDPLPDSLEGLRFNFRAYRAIKLD